MFRKSRQTINNNHESRQNRLASEVEFCETSGKVSNVNRQIDEKLAEIRRKCNLYTYLY